MNNPHEYEVSCLKARLYRTADRRTQSRLREQIEIAERQARNYEEQKKRNELNGTQGN